MIHAIYEMIVEVTGEREFSTNDHLLAFKGERRDGNKDRDDANDSKLRGVFNYQGDIEKRLFLCTNHMG